MSDNTLTVYEKCKHGRVDAHDDVIADVIGCPGGREIVLRMEEVDLAPDKHYPKWRHVWLVEVGE